VFFEIENLRSKWSKMPYTVKKFTKKTIAETKRQLEEKINAMPKEDFERTQKFINMVSELKATGKLTKDEYLCALRAKILGDQSARKIMHEIAEKNQLEFDMDKAVDQFLESKQLPQTNPDERIETLKIGQKQILELERMKLTEAEGLDPNLLILGYGEDGEPVLEEYKLCNMCKKVFKTFKNESFCQPSCRENWVIKNMPDAPLQQEIFSERNSESWNWLRVGNGKFKRVWNEEKNSIPDESEEKGENENV